MIVIGYTADRFGKAALEHGIDRGEAAGHRLLVRQLDPGRLVRRTPRSRTEREVHDVEARLADCGVPFEVEPARRGRRRRRELLATMERPDAELLVIGIRASQPGRKVVAGQRVSAAAPGVPEAGAGGEARRVVDAAFLASP